MEDAVLLAVVVIADGPVLRPARSIAGIHVQREAGVEQALTVSVLLEDDERGCAVADHDDGSLPRDEAHDQVVGDDVLGRGEGLTERVVT